MTKFILEAVSELNWQIREITVDALDLLMRHAWLGKVRKSKSVAKKAALIATNDLTARQVLPCLLERMKQMEHFFAEGYGERGREAEYSRRVLGIGGNQTVLSEMLQPSYKNLLKEIMMCGWGETWNPGKNAVCSLKSVFGDLGFMLSTLSPPAARSPLPSP